jgi:hypothetical protein
MRPENELGRRRRRDTCVWEQWECGWEGKSYEDELPDDDFCKAASLTGAAGQLVPGSG